MYVLIAIYLLVGVLMLVRDLTRHITNRPVYFYQSIISSKILPVLMTIVFWPLLLIFRNTPAKRKVRKEMEDYMRKSLEKHGLNPDKPLNQLKKKMGG